MIFHCKSNQKCIYYCWDCWLWETQIHPLTKLHLHQKAWGCKDLGLCSVCSHLHLAQGWTEIILFLSQLILVSSHHQVSGHLFWDLAEMGVTSHIEKVDKMPSLLVLKVGPVRQSWTLSDWFPPMRCLTLFQYYKNHKPTWHIQLS